MAVFIVIPLVILLEDWMYLLRESNNEEPTKIIISIFVVMLSLGSFARNRALKKSIDTLKQYLRVTVNCQETNLKMPAY